VAAQALKALEQRPSDVHTLAQQLASAEELTADSELVQLVENLIANLDDLGLIEPIV
jgi:hypothetical protein